MPSPPASEEKPRNCIRCSSTFQVQSEPGSGLGVVSTFACPHCGWANSVLGTCTQLSLAVQCSCGTIFQVTVDPKATRVMATEAPETPDESSGTYKHLTVRRSRVECPQCHLPNFLFGSVVEVK